MEGDEIEERKDERLDERDGEVRIERGMRREPRRRLRPTASRDSKAGTRALL